jgi:hypothetical protein
MPLKASKQIYDNVHGYIGLTDVELGVVDAPIFQRLRGITQLGPASLVYPGATHTRFEHCLGTMFMMDQFLQHVRSMGEPITEDPDVIQKMRLAALLHDIGHYPMSHTFENVITRRMHGSGHEKAGEIFARRFLGDALSSYDVRDITGIAGGNDKSALGMLLSSAFDADKSDYLLRDSYHTGVGYGKVGIQRLMRSASFEDGRIIFDKDEEVVESYLLGRYHMYRSVYHHKTVVAFYTMMSRIFELLVAEGRIKHPNDVVGSQDEDEITAYDDHMLYHALREYAGDGKDAFLKELVRMLLARKPLYAAFINPLPEQSERSSANLMIRSMQYDDRKTEEFARKAGIPAKWAFPEYLRDLGLVDDKTPILIKGKGAAKSVLKSHGLIMHLVGSKRLYDARIYVHPKYKARVATYMRKIS